jgi:hypothetical protein
MGCSLIRRLESRSLSDHHAGFESLLRGRQADILTAWRELMLASFPEQTARFLRRERDPFRNPLGHRIRESTEVLLEGIGQGRALHLLAGPLDALVRFRAIQGQPPSQALEFVFLLKRACRDTLGASLNAEAASALESRIDGLALSAFDAYSRCREEISEIRVREARRRVATLFERVAAGQEQGCRA